MTLSLNIAFINLNQQCNHTLAKLAIDHPALSDIMISATASSSKGNF